MKNSIKKLDEAVLLRQKAEQLYKNKKSTKTVDHTAGAESSRTEAKNIKLLNELEVHQIELEMQNEELHLAKEKAETNAKKYSELYNFAPFGYFTLDHECSICELNFSGARMLGKDRSKLINRNFKLFITPENRIDFTNFFDKVSENKTVESCEVRLTTNKNPDIFIHIGGVFSEAEQKYSLTVVDITASKKVEEELKKNIDDLDRVFNLSAYMVCISSPEGYFQKISPAFTETLGFSEKEFLSKPFIEFVHPNDKQSTIDNMEPLTKGTPVIRFPNRYVCKDDSYRWLEWTARSFVKGGGIYAIAYDITERKKAEDALKVSEEKYKSMIASAPSFINSISQDYKIIELNYTVDGVPKEKIIGQSIFNFVDEEFHKLLKSSLDKSFNNGKASSFEFKALGPNNTTSWYESKLSPTRDAQDIITSTMMISNDITERKRLEEAFKESKEKYANELSLANKELTYQNEEKEKRAVELVQTKDLLDEAEDLAHMGSFEVNLNTFESKRSKGVKKLFGSSYDEEISNFGSWLERVHPDERVKEQEIIEKFKQGRKYQKWERRFVKFDGEERIFETIARMFKDGAGIPEKIIGINMDVTETRMNERLQLEAVIKAQEDLRHQLALEIHDGLGPMVAGSKLFLEKISNKIDERILPEYTGNLETLADVHKGLRDLSHRLVPKSLYDFGLAVGIETLCDKMEDATNLEINFRNEGENSLLKGDFALNLYRIAQELISNVIKHAKASKVNIELIGREKKLTLVVQDNGVGTTKNDEDTQGIGMLNVQSRVKIMNGKLRIESSSGFGTKITIKVPLK